MSPFIGEVGKLLYVPFVELSLDLIDDLTYVYHRICFLYLEYLDLE